MEIDPYKAMFGLAIGVISWFLKSLITGVQKDLKELETRVSDNSTKVEVLKSDHGNLGVKIDEIGKDLKEISLYIRNLKQS